MRAKPRAVFLMGPTGTGKTDLAMALADRLPCHLISVDSAMVYRGLDIGAAKPDAATLARYPHALVNICDPAETYSVARFLQDAGRELQLAVDQGRLPIFVGGTMLYFKALRDGLATLPGADADIRAALERRAESEGWPALHAELAQVDPATASRLHPNHSARILRALEVWMLTAVPLSAWHREGNEGGLHQRVEAIQVALMPANRDLLHERLALRFERMLEAGFVEEVRHLKKRKDLHPDLPAMRAVGYRQVWDYLEGRLTEDQMVAAALAATRQLAKRQMTWLRGWPGLEVLDPAENAGQWKSPADLVRDCLKFL